MVLDSSRGAHHCSSLWNATDQQQTKMVWTACTVGRHFPDQKMASGTESLAFCLYPSLNLPDKTMSNSISHTILTLIYLSFILFYLRFHHNFGRYGCHTVKMATSPQPVAGATYPHQVKGHSQNVDSFTSSCHPHHLHSLFSLYFHHNYGKLWAL